MQSWVRWWTTTIWWQKSASFPVVLLAEWLSSCPPKSVWTQASCVLPNPQSSGSKFLIIVQSLSNHDFFHPSQEIDLSPHPHPHATEVLKNIEEHWRTLRASRARPLLQGVLGESHVCGTRWTPGRRDHQRQGQRDDRSLQWLPAVQLVGQWLLMATVPAELAWCHVKTVKTVK